MQTFQMHTIHDTISKITLNITTDFLTKVWVPGRHWLGVEDRMFLEFSILSESSTPSQATNTAGHLPRDERLAWFIFEKVSANAYVWITTVHLWIVLSGKNENKKMVVGWGGASWVSNSVTYERFPMTTQQFRQLSVLPATSHKCQKDVDSRELIKKIHHLALHRKRNDFNAWPGTSQVSPALLLLQRHGGDRGRSTVLSGHWRRY